MTDGFHSQYQIQLTGLGCLGPWTAKESEIGRILAQQERLKDDY